MIPTWTDEQAAQYQADTLKELMRCEAWPPGNAFRVLAGLSFGAPEGEFDPDCALDGSQATREQWNMVDYLQQQWEMAGHDMTERLSPQEWIKWSKARGHEPTWYDTTVGKKSSGDVASKSRAETNAEYYETYLKLGCNAAAVGRHYEVSASAAKERIREHKKTIAATSPNPYAQLKQ